MNHYDQDTGGQGRNGSAATLGDFPLLTWRDEADEREAAYLADEAAARAAGWCGPDEQADELEAGHA